MSTRTIIPTHSAYLELKSERTGMQEGYHFLDEKRLILASEILTTLKDFETTMADWREARREALRALRGALGRHGLEELSVYPAAPALECDIAAAARSVLGVRIDLPPAVDSSPATVAASAVVPKAGSLNRAAPIVAAKQSPEAEDCRNCFARLPSIAARLALLTGNLERLRVEYVRTARRARALEDVLLPEIDETLSAIDTALEELDREEVIRVRRVEQS